MRSSTALLLLGLLVLPSLAFAKRTPAPKVDPVVVDGIRFVVPNDKGTDAYVEAWDVATGKRLWQRTIFTTWLNPIKEHCNQWVFIKEMRQEEGRLIILSERDRGYSLDLKTRRVRKLNCGEGLDVPTRRT